MRAGMAVIIASARLHAVTAADALSGSVNAFSWTAASGAVFSREDAEVTLATVPLTPKEKDKLEAQEFETLEVSEQLVGRLPCGLAYADLGDRSSRSRAGVSICVRRCYRGRTPCPAPPRAPRHENSTTNRQEKEPHPYCPSPNEPAEKRAQKSKEI
ncbi:hypothetical protein AAFF_G00032570 [Aldrovandia affinis]|uniref:Uncharacterized protein n=1 Tax=Aldrovandia affinis TaxID=143900 RepID=A0AAD7S485_9TELE|nr:hypothetical protein AAFF_G00032570 [Aldrovandia affinis]